MADSVEVTKLTHVGACFARRSNTVTARFAIAARQAGEGNTRTLDGCSCCDGLDFGSMTHMRWRPIIMDVVRDV